MRWYWWLALWPLAALAVARWIYTSTYDDRDIDSIRSDPESDLDAIEGALVDVYGEDVSRIAPETDRPTLGDSGRLVRSRAPHVPR